MKRQSFQHGSVILTARAKGPGVWVFRYRDNNQQKAVRLGTELELTTKAAAEKKATMLRLAINERQVCVTVGDLCDRYELDGIPERHSTAAPYLSILKRVRARWGTTRLDAFVKDISAIELWLKTLTKAEKDGKPQGELARKSKAHIKAFVHRLIECAMRWGMLPVQRNPIALVEITGSNKRRRPLTIVPIQTYRRLLQQLEPHQHVQVMVQIAMCLGLRVSEILGLRWEDFDFDSMTVHVQRSVVGKNEAETKTEGSDEVLPLHAELAAVLEVWREKPSIKGWLFGNPVTERPYHRDSLLADYLAPAGKACGVPSMGWHSFRHTYRSLLRDAGDVPLEVQQSLMRHADIRTTTEYGGTMAVEKLRPANSKIVEMVNKRRAA